MKKTISVNIGGRIFYIEEDAYSRLDTYLAEIKQHFSTFPDSDEVVADIETRISEHFESKQLGSETNIVSLAHVEELIGVMGNVQDFGDTEPTGEEAHQAQQSSKLFRDPDNAVLGGVASGIAAYFGWDPVWVRVVFVVSVFFGGYSILLYIILWIAMPEAETATDKLRMKGNPVTLSAIEQSVREQFADTTKVRSRAHKAGNAVRDLVTSIGGLLAKIFVIAGKIIAVIIAIGSVVGIAALTFILVMILVTGTSPEYIQFPLRDFLGTAQYLMALFAAFFIAVIPLAMLLQLCSRLLGQRKALNKTLLIGLAALWFVAATVVGAISVRNAPRYETFAAQHPLLKQMEQTIEVADFTRVSAEHGVRVIIQQGEKSVSTRGTQMELDQLDIRTENGVLTISYKPFKEIWCIFCINQPAEVYITVPTLDQIEAAHGTSIGLTDYTGTGMTVRAQHGSSVKGVVHLQQLTITAEHGAYVNLSGEATGLTVKAQHGSRVSADELIATNATVDAAHGSSLFVNVTDTLRATSQHGSRIRYANQPKQIIGNTVEQNIRPVAPEAPEFE